MVTVPAIVWRYGPLVRGLVLGAGVGGFLGALAWIDSGVFAVGVVAFVALFVVYGGWMSRRMSRQWPGAAHLTGADREAVARAARSGTRLGDPALVPALTAYRDGLHEAAHQGRWFRWLIWFVLVVSLASAVYDGLFGSWGNLVASAVYLVLLLAEMFWWPPRLRQLLANADTAVDLAVPRTT
jgi:hypothetical protein